MKKALAIILLSSFLSATMFAIGCDSQTTVADGDQDNDMETDQDTSNGDKEDEQESDIEVPDGDLESSEIDSELPNGPFVFAVISDTHIIDDFYVGPEGNELDTESIFYANERLEAALIQVNNLTDPAVELVLIPGDFVHNYPSDEWDFFFENETRFDIAKSIISASAAPVHVGLDNHDYDIPGIPRDFTERLVKEKWGIDPYYTVEHKGVKFIHINNFLGATMDFESDDYASAIGSFGKEQLDWLDGELSDGKPSFVFFHFPLLLEKSDEEPGLDVKTVLIKHLDNVLCVFAGHHHRWQDWDINGSHIYTVPHIVVGSTRYDEDNILYIEVDPQLMEWRMINYDCIGWGGMYANPYVPGETCIPPQAEKK
jgi:hypothetical protein